jgi:hypothetical protein
MTEQCQGIWECTMKRPAKSPLKNGPDWEYYGAGCDKCPRRIIRGCVANDNQKRPEREAVHGQRTLQGE